MAGRPTARGGPSGNGARRTYSVGARRGGTVSVRNNRGRFVAGRVVLTLVLVVAGLRMGYIHGFEADALSERAERQRTTPIDLPAPRGAIVDRDGNKLAFSVETRTLWVHLRSMREDWAEVARSDPGSGENFDTRAAEVAGFIARELPHRTTKEQLLRLFHKDAPFTYLVEGVKPSVAEKIEERYPEIGYEKRAKRVYPGGDLAMKIVGYANWRQDDPDPSRHNLGGLSGLESMRNGVLAGTPGRQIVNTPGQGLDLVIPGTERNVQPATPGSDLELTLDSDVQYEVQRTLADYVERAHAEGGSAVVLDAETGEVHALANDTTFDPDEDELTNEALGNDAVTTPFEPGSVAKVVTATAAIEDGIVGPDSVLEVPGSLQIADHTVHDAWTHGTQPFTTRGVFAKSSNVGTLQLARELGPERFLEELEQFGAGRTTGIGLPGESAGYVPPRDEWSGTTFGNLPIGQGMSMTVVQMASMYQALANDGVRVEPRIVRARITPEGERVPEPAPRTTRVADPATADTVTDMLRAVVQDGDYEHRGTAPEAALEGYQISGKTGTGQQVDPETGRYSDTLHNVTFAGIVPADDPRLVVGVWLDAPDTTLPEYGSAAPLFREITGFLAQHYRLPVSDEPAPTRPLVR